MAKSKKGGGEPQYFCKDCAFAYGFHGSNYKGEVFICYCKKSEHTKLMSKKACGEFKLKSK